MSKLTEGAGGVVLIRSLIFNFAFYSNFFVQAVLFSPVLLMPKRYGWAVMHFWAASSLWLHRTICGVTEEVRHVDRLKAGGCLIAAKHQSAWETLKLANLVPRPTFILKKELMSVPLFGWYLAKLDQIPIDRKKGALALKEMANAANESVQAGNQVIIFPEGTRMVPGAAANYKPGSAYLYKRLNCVCIPVALNSGLIWPRRALSHLPGRIVVEVCKPIDPGLTKVEFNRALEERIESASNHMINEAVAENPTLVQNLDPEWENLTEAKTLTKQSD